MVTLPPRLTNMITLAMDTSTEATSVALVGAPGGPVLHTRIDGRRHAEVLAPLLRDVLHQANVGPKEVELLACGVGPGPFTGLRVGIAAAIAFGFARDVPVVGVCSLDVTARAAVRDLGTSVTVLSRARTSEVCWAAYNDRAVRVAGPIIRREPLVVTGACVGDAGPVDEVRYPSALDLAELVVERIRLGEALPDDVALPEDTSTESGQSSATVLVDRVRAARILLPPRPIYLRRPDAVVPASLAGGSP